MNKSKCISSAQEIGKFVCATGGNWRSSIYIECSECKFNYVGAGMNFLLAFDAEGCPLLLPEHDAQIIFGRLIDKSECLLQLSNLMFLEIFHAWFQSHIKDRLDCPFWQLLRRQNPHQ